MQTSVFTIKFFFILTFQLHFLRNVMLYSNKLNETHHVGFAWFASVSGVDSAEDFERLVISSARQQVLGGFGEQQQQPRHDEGGSSADQQEDSPGVVREGLALDADVRWDYQPGETCPITIKKKKKKKNDQTISNNSFLFFARI